LLWREWEGESVVFNSGSGQTHFLNAVSAEALRAMEETSMTTAALVEHFLELMPESEPDALARQMDRLVRDFAELGLIDPCLDE